MVNVIGHDRDSGHEFDSGKALGRRWFHVGMYSIVFRGSATQSDGRCEILAGWRVDVENTPCQTFPGVSRASWRQNKRPPAFVAGGLGLGAWRCPTFAWGSTLSSARGGFTSEVGMGSGGSRPPWPPGNSAGARRPAGAAPLAGGSCSGNAHIVGSAPARPRAGWALYGQASRAISAGQLHASPRFHTRPINLVVFEGPSGDSRSRGGLISGGASRLDAFSGYPVRT